MYTYVHIIILLHDLKFFFFNIKVKKAFKQKKIFKFQKFIFAIFSCRKTKIINLNKLL